MNFELLPNRGNYRGSSHPYKINFLFTTYVKDCEDIPNLTLRYKFTNFSEINGGTLDENVFIDIIGEIVEMKEIKNITCRGHPSRLLNLQLRDLMGSVINVTLWEEFADDIFSYAKSSPSGHIILLGSMMKINLFHGDISIQSSMFATKLFTDPVVKEISEFKTKMSKSTNPEVNLFIPQFTPSSVTQLATETFSLSEQRTIAQISELAKGHMGNILATVSSIQSDIP